MSTTRTFLVPVDDSEVREGEKREKKLFFLADSFHGRRRRPSSSTLNA
jgi:hypothetical protein